MNELQVVQMQCGRPGAQRPLSMAFDRRFHTQNLIYSILSQGQLCDPPLVRAVTETLAEGDTFIDVGSHIGYFSLLAIPLVGPAGSAFAFEPNPHTFLVLAANAQINRFSNLYAYNLAVGDQSGTAEFNINAQDEGMSSLVYQAAGGAKISVALTTLDTLAMCARLEKIRMLKIDVEGFEENVIRGAQGLLARGCVESIVFEINNQFASLPRHRDLAIRQHLSQLGFASYLIKPWMGEDAWQRRFGQFNYLRIPDDANVDIGYGNILATRRQVEAAT